MQAKECLKAHWFGSHRMRAWTLDLSNLEGSLGFWRRACQKCLSLHMRSIYTPSKSCKSSKDLKVKCQVDLSEQAYVRGSPPMRRLLSPLYCRGGLSPSSFGISGVRISKQGLGFRWRPCTPFQENGGSSIQSDSKVFLWSAALCSSRKVTRHFCLSMLMIWTARWWDCCPWVLSSMVQLSTHLRER